MFTLSKEVTNLSTPQQYSSKLQIGCHLIYFQTKIMIFSTVPASNFENGGGADDALLILNGIGPQDTPHTSLTFTQQQFPAKHLTARAKWFPNSPHQTAL
jgi:hypothetical protein